MNALKVKDLMTPQPSFVNPKATLREAAKIMKDIDCGFLPVGTANKVNGIITDRDIVLRAVSEGLDTGKEKVIGHMTAHVYACNEEDTLEDAAEKMRSHRVSRLVVRNKAGAVTGVLSLGGILRNEATAHDVTNVVRHVMGACI